MFGKRPVQVSINGKKLETPSGNFGAKLKRQTDKTLLWAAALAWAAIAIRVTFQI